MRAMGEDGVEDLIIEDEDFDYFFRHNEKLSSIQEIFKDQLIAPVPDRMVIY